MSVLELTSTKLTHTGPYFGAGIILAFIAWIVFLVYLRKKPIGFLFWFPFTAISALGSLLFAVCAIGFVGGSMNPGGGEGAGFALLGFGLAALYLLVCPIALTISIVCHPQFDKIHQTSAAITVVVVMVLIPLPFILEQKADSLVITFTLVDANHRPLLGATVSKTDPPSTYHFWKTDENGNAPVDAKFDDIVAGGFIVSGHKTIAYGLHTPPDASKLVEASFYVTPQATVPYIMTHAEYPVTNGHDVHITYAFANN